MFDNPPVHDTAELTRYIGARFHARHRLQLASMAEWVETLHFGDTDVPEGLFDLLRKMIGEMEGHMKKEELILLPAIRTGGGPGNKKPIAAMSADHDEHDRAVVQIGTLTCNLTLPTSACGTWTRLYEGLSEFMEDLTEQMRLENNVLFLQFEAGIHINA